VIQIFLGIAKVSSLILLVLATDAWRPVSAKAPIVIADIGALAKALRAVDFLIPDHHLARLDAVPRTRITGPGKAVDWREKVPFQQSVYLRLLLSAVLQENEALIAKRARVQSLVITSARPADLDWLSKYILKYRIGPVENLPTETNKKSLLLRLDAIPPSIVIAKGALDSGWLPSPYAQPEAPEFGRWTLGRVTAAGTDGPAFRKPHAALQAYMHHLNTDPDFDAMRNARAALRTEGRPLDGHALAAYLAPALGRIATQKVQRVIRRNTLKRADRARLGTGPVIVFRRVENDDAEARDQPLSQPTTYMK